MSALGEFQLIERYFQRFEGVRRYMDETRAQAKAQGYVQTVLGRRLYLPEINSPNGPRRAVFGLNRGPDRQLGGWDRSQSCHYWSFGPDCLTPIL